MFTGLIEDIGSVTAVVRKTDSLTITISYKKPFKEIKKGDSISVNGACLTVTEFSRGRFSADLSSETAKLTTFSSIRVGDKVNLERATQIGGRLNGHIVTGHVDGVCELVEKTIRSNSFELGFSAPDIFLKNIVLKGSVSLDGVSLTVSKVFQNGFSVVVIPHTSEETTLISKKPGDKLNVETDILSKYIERLLEGTPPSATERMFVDSGFLPMGIVDN